VDADGGAHRRHRCNIGKMTAQLQVRDAVRALGHRVNFAATGQTGILLEGRGIAVDAVIADFIGGAAERLTIEAAQDADIVLVEGQGSLLHPPTPVSRWG
jgi:uncharacterized NAD-dependent epimerase/dehydratase family protein